MTTEAWNERRYDGERGRYEVWYMTWNHPQTGQGLWLRFVLESSTDGHSRGELWFARFDPHAPERTFGVHRRYAVTAVTSSSTPFNLTIGNSQLGHSHTFGAFDGDGHAIAWDLRWDPAERELKFFPDLAHSLKIGETETVSPNPRVAVTGSIVIDGERLAFDRAVLGQTHVWGKKHAFAWTWAHCGDFAGAPDGLLELVAARLHRRGVTTPPLVMVTLDLDGERHRLNQFRHVALNRARWGRSDVHFTARSATFKVEGELTCTPEQMVVAPYLDPDGTPVFCSNTEIGDARLVISRRAGLGWRAVRTLESHGRAHFEVGSREADPAVPHRHVTVE
jgi:hypothetical protein